MQSNCGELPREMKGNASENCSEKFVQEHYALKKTDILNFLAIVRIMRLLKVRSEVVHSRKNPSYARETL